MTRLPNFIYIGPDKAGSSWLHDVLIEHPEIFMTPAKDLYFFDRYFDKGLDWYAHHFERAADEKIVGEVCQDYLFHPDAAERIGKTLDDVRFMVTLRDPVDRAFSSYLYMLKMGQRPGTFGAALRGRPELIEHGRYGSGLARFADRFGDDSIYVEVFDNLQADPEAFIERLLGWLDVAPFELSEELLATRLPASKARSPLVARMVRAAADWAREHNGAEIVGRVKRAPIVHKVLYQPLAEKPELLDEDVAFVRAALDDELAQVEQRFGVDLRTRWGWESEGA